MVAKAKKAATTRAAKPAASSSGLVDEQLARYRGMRDFEQTAEPSGQATSAADTGPLPFVIQKHAATRLHYDFRLGLHGVLKSWAVTKGPSYVPGDKRLAVQVEDHPMEYGGFEGTIPKGQYGGGTVMLWDEGTWEPVGDPDEGLTKGNLKFILHGKKLHGKWVLVRMGGKAANEAKPNWLLIKEHDEHEQSADDEPITEKEPNSVLPQRDIDAIARDEDHVWQSNRPETSSGNKSSAGKPARSAPFAPSGLPGKKEALPPFIPPQLASEAPTPPVGENWVHELKLDGYRVQAHIDKSGKTRLYTRSGLDWTHRMPTVAREVSKLAVESAILDGEVVVLTADGQSSFAALQAAFEEGAKHPLTYFVFDLLHLNGHNLRSQALTERKGILSEMLETLEDQSTVRYGQHIQAEGKPILDAACQMQAEGIVSKRADSAYVSGRSKSWLKIKCDRRQEFVVGGFTKPANGSEGIGALLLGGYEDKKLVYAGRTGTGFTQASSRKLRQELEEMRQSKMPFADVPASAAKGALWVKPELVAQVQFSPWPADNLVRQASFKGLREDKKAKEVVREMALHGIPNARAASVGGSKKAAATTAAKTPDSRALPRVTHPDKIVDRESALTKEQLVAYYAEVGDHILPHIADRPLSIVRCPSGTAAKCFFQKHVKPGLPKGIGSVEIVDRKSGKPEPYITLSDATVIPELGQLNVFELHPWGAPASDFEHPDRIIFDLDPDASIEWKTLGATASEVRARLEKLGLESFLKSTGGKGLHIVAPIRSEHDWPTIKEFAQQFVLAMEADTPSLYITKMTKSARTGRIYLDYLRNERGATAVAPYSPRSRNGVPVSVPMDWSELKAQAAPHCLVGVFDEWRKRLAHDPWMELPKTKQRLPQKGIAAVSPKKSR